MFAGAAASGRPGGVDVGLLVLIAVCMLILLILHYVQNVPTLKSSDLVTIYHKLLRDDPTATGYSLGWIAERKAFKNVYAVDVPQDPGKPSKLEMTVRYESYPITAAGKPIRFNDGHGKITDVKKTDGGGAGERMEVKNINTTFPLQCPSGFEGPQCTLAPLCGPNDVGKYKLLSRAQYSALQMYNLKNSIPATVGDSADTSDYHKRLRVLCKSNTGDYTVEPCPDNTLVDERTNQCRAYDLCVDKLAGHKHQFDIGDGVPAPDEYYMCSADGKSVREKCAEGSVFSAQNSGCVTKNQCTGRGNDRIAVDSQSYVQCGADTGTVVRCEYGVDVKKTATGDGSATVDVPFCKNPTCTPEEYRYTDDMIEYVSGVVDCDADNRETRTLCATHTVDKSYNYSWGEPFSYKFDKWPATVYDAATKTCVTPTVESIIKPDAKFKTFRWGSAMYNSFEFDPRSQMFVCRDGPDVLRLDYLHGKTIPEIDTSKYFVDYTRPCQKVDEVLEYGKTAQFRKYEKLMARSGGATQQYAPHNGFPMIYGLKISKELPLRVRINKDEVTTVLGRQPNTYWPTVFNRVGSGAGASSVLEYYVYDYDPDTDAISCRKLDTIPVGFVLPTHKLGSNESNFLVYRNWPEFEVLRHPSVLFLYMIGPDVRVPQ